MRAQAENIRKLSFVLLRARVSLTVLAMTACIVATNAVAALGDSGNVLIHTDAGDVTIANIQENLAALPEAEKARLLHDSAALANLAELVAAQKIIVREALDKGWAAKKDVALALDRARADTIVRTYVEASSQPPKEYPSDTEVDAAYEANRLALMQPKQFHYAEILVALAKDADQSTQDKASAKLAAIQAQLNTVGADFGALSTSQSDDRATAQKKGDAGIVAEGQLPTVVKAALASMKPGEISQPVRVDDGWLLLKLIDVTEAHVRPLKDVRDELRTVMRNARAEQGARARIESYVAKVPKPDPKLLAQIASDSAK
jgi:parvulin-like peptidyl-prolyl isomerase